MRKNQAISINLQIKFIKLEHLAICLAESYAVKIQDKKMFADLLKIALQDEKKSSNQYKSSNKVYKARANWLLSRIDELFFM